MFRNFIARSCLVLLAASTTAKAGQVILTDGGTHTINSASSDSYLVGSGTTLNIATGAAIVEGPLPTQGVTAITGFSGAFVNIAGGLVAGGDNSTSQYSGGFGLFLTLSSLTSSGGQVKGGNGYYGGTAVALYNDGPTTISGGTFIGGDTTNPNGAGGYGITFQQSAPLTISGGTFGGGIGPGYYGGSTGQALVVIGGGNVEISGGVFLTSIATNFLFPGELDFFGKDLDYLNGILSGTLTNGDQIDVPLYTLNTKVTFNATRTEVSFSQLAAIPEPASVVQLGVGLAAVLGLAARR